MGSSSRSGSTTTDGAPRAPLSVGALVPEALGPEAIAWTAFDLAGALRGDLDQHLGVVQQHPRDAEALLHAARQLRRQRILFRREFELAAKPARFVVQVTGDARYRLWVNGEEATGDDAVSDADEVALIPPVSGGSQAISTQAAISPGTPSVLSHHAAPCSSESAATTM